MTTIAIVPDNAEGRPVTYRAIAGTRQSVGRTAGEALDALTAQLDESEKGTLLVIQHQRPDQFFTADQQRRLGELMGRWRAARDASNPLPPADQAELDALVEAELRAATLRAATLASGLAP
ncbi:MAG: hypothetical protein IT429_02445 [Gemmataceae bacterium]|nr:hypothetical protein [Gemmataceae bacterium]